VIPIAEARRHVLSSCAVLEPRYEASGAAEGCVLAETVRAAEPVPPFTNSAMDGYALRAADTRSSPTRLKVVGTVMAGDDEAVTVAPGQSVRIMTGAPLPRGADAVCMVERTRVDEQGTVVVIEDVLEPGTNVRSAGEDIATGSDVFGPGTLLGPARIGVLASLGIDSVLVHPRPRVGVLSTGDELVTEAGPLPRGKIRDANRPALLGQLRRDGFGTVDLGIVGDEEADLVACLEDARSRCDAVVASGGVSVGDRDLMKAVLEKLGGDAMRSMQVAVKPAKPFAFGLLDATRVPAFGLPGNPVSSLISYELFVRPALRSMAGHRTLDRPRLSAIAACDLPRRPDGKLHLLRVVAHTDGDGSLRVRPSGGQGSHMLRAMADANALALLPDGDGVSAGRHVEILLLDGDELVQAAEAAW
jgi:molybdopterin molybdotransferase